MYKSYIKYNKLRLQRSKKEAIYILCKKFMQLFTDHDKNTIINTLNFLSIPTNIIIFLISFSSYLILGILCSNIIESILFMGLINSVHILFKIYNNVNKSEIEVLKDEFKFLFNFIPQHKRNTFIIKKISYDLFSNIFLYSLIPYFISQIIISALYSKSYIISLIILVLVTYANYIFSMFVIINKINIKSRYIFNIVIGILTLIITCNCSILLKSFNFSNFININLSKILLSNIKINNLGISKYQLVIILINILLVSISLSYTIYLFIKNESMLINIYSNKNIDIGNFDINEKTTYKTIVHRELNQENKLLIIKLGSIGISIFLLVFHYFFIKNSLITFITPIVILAYNAVIISTITNYYLCKDLLRKSNVITNYYFIKKYNCKEELFKQTLLVILKHCLILLVPMLTICIVEFSINSIIWFINQFCTFICVSVIITQRLYNISKNNIEDIESISSISITSNSFEDYCIFGSPVIVVVSFIAYSLKYNIGYYYINIALILYTFTIIIYTLVKVFLFYRKEKIYDSSN